jgi:formylglycine-generating enzyme required for sulfatase activity
VAPRVGGGHDYIMLEYSRCGLLALLVASAGIAAGCFDRTGVSEPSDDETKGAREKVLARADEAENALAKKLGLSRPFTAGLTGQIGMVTVRWIPAGQFMMGSSGGRGSQGSLEEVRHRVDLSIGLFLAETECTQAQWEAVMGSNPSHFNGSDRPVEQVSWTDALEYCQKLTMEQRAAGLLPEGWEWRLPTEAEWEYAARAGTKGPRHGDLDAIAWHAANSGNQTHPVKLKAANAWGLHDMIGNVWEWCSDCYGSYPAVTVTDPMGPGWGSNRVCRGGSWFHEGPSARSANRNKSDPGNRSNILGFRPALSSTR